MLSSSTLTEWNVSSLTIVIYTIRLTVTDNDKSKSKTEEYVVVEIVDNDEVEAPLKIEATLITDTNAYVHIYWEDKLNPQDVTYNLYRSENTDFAAAYLIAADIIESNCKDIDISFGCSYYYWVTTASRSDNESVPASNYAFVKLDSMLGLEDYYTYTSFKTSEGKGNINTANGNLVYTALDFDYENSFTSKLFERTYNSQSSSLSQLGYGWDFAFNTCLFQQKDDANNFLGMIFKDFDGTYQYIEYDYKEGIYVSPKGTFMKLNYDNTSGEHIINTKDNVSYVFDDSLKLIMIQDACDIAYMLTYDEGDRLTCIESSDGEIFIFSYYQQEDYSLPFYTVDDAHEGLTARVTDSNGAGRYYIYKSEESLLESVLDNDDNLLSCYLYKDGTNWLANIGSAEQETMTLEYTSDCKISELVVFESEYYFISYIDDTTIVIDSEDEHCIYYCDLNGCVQSTESSDGSKVTYLYNSNFQVVQLCFQEYTDGDLITYFYTFSYDSITGDLVESTKPADRLK